MRLTPSGKGGIAEVAIAAAAVKLGIYVSRPIVEGRRYDLIFDVEGRLMRLQCKSASVDSGVVRVGTRTSRHSPGRGYISGTHSERAIDLLAAHCAELDAVYVLPVEEIAGQTMVYLRIEPARNNQNSLVRWARDYELGAIAQLGERSAGSRKVEGSSPSSSTPPKAA